MTEKTLVFSHANSFGAGTYRMLFDSLRARGFSLHAIEKFGHDPRWPVTSNWPHLVEQLREFTQDVAAHNHGPVWLVGHSLGGLLSLMCAALHPQLARGVLLIDSPALGGWRANALGMAKHTQLVGSISPGKVSRARRNQWDSRQAALEHFQRKAAFAAWHPQVLQDYISTGTHDAGGQRVLSFDRDVETAIYNTLPHNLDGILRRHPLQCPCAFIGGTESVEMRQVGMTITRRLTHERIMLLPGSHLFPMERPIATAAAIEASLLAMLDGPPD